MSTSSSGDQQDVRFVRSVLKGTGLGGAAYGIHIALFLECIYLLVFRPRDKIKWPLITFVLVNFALSSIQFGSQMKLSDMIVVDGVYFHNYGSVWHLINHSTAFASNWMSDALLIYRLFMFWNSDWKIIAFPCLALAGSIATAISHSVEGARLKEAFGSPLLVKLLSSFWALTFSVNVYVTVLIVGRIIFLQRKIDALLSPPPTSPSPWHTRMRSVFRLRKSKDEEQLHNPYNDEPRSGPPAPRVSLRSRNRDAIYSATSMLLESAALFTITSAIFEGAYAAKDASTELFWPIWGQMAAISALLIIVRVARGTAWTHNDVVEISSIRIS